MPEHFSANDHVGVQQFVPLEVIVTQLRQRVHYDRPTPNLASSNDLLLVAGLLLEIHEQNIFILRGQAQMAGELEQIKSDLSQISDDVGAIGTDVGKIAAKLQAGANAGGIALLDAQDLATKADAAATALHAARTALDELSADTAPTAAPTTAPTTEPTPADTGTEVPDASTGTP